MDESTLLSKIRKLRVLGQEWATVDAKRELSLKEEGSKAEFVKDIVAMANNGEPSYLIIGLEDKTFADVGALSQHYTTNDINQILENRIDPPVAINYQEFTIHGIEYAVVEVIGRNLPYIVGRDITHNKTDRKQTRITKGSIYVRRHDRTEGISRADLDELLKKRWLFKEYEGEPEIAQSILRDRPDYWEFRLTIELLRPKLVRIRREFEGVKKGLHYSPSRAIRGAEFVAWQKAKVHDLQLLIKLMTGILTQEIPASWGRPGQSGDPIEIKRSVDRLIQAYDHLIVWEADLRSVLPPEAFVRLRETLEGWAEQLFNSLESFPSQIEAVLNNPPLSGKFRIELTFESPNADSYQSELEQLLSRSHEWANEY